jgi:predicted NAD-dependent protein-ADP-ribosyltransferase YbiA (DUF1768 family)
LKEDVIVLAPDREEDAALLDAFASLRAGDVFELARAGERGIVLRRLGPRPEACREPINISSRVADEAWRPIGNFAHTPFELDGRAYASIEGFWQGLKFPADRARARVAALHGQAAKSAAAGIEPPRSVRYGGATLRYGTPEHWALMQRACEAKFTQNVAARAALLATGERPLTHVMRRDSRSIPGIVMSDIWMKLRGKLRRGGR